MKLRVYFPDMLRKTETKQKIAITRHGKVVASVSSPENEAQRKALIDQLLAFRRIKLADSESIAEFRYEGQR